MIQHHFQPEGYLPFVMQSLRQYGYQDTTADDAYASYVALCASLLRGESPEGVELVIPESEDLIATEGLSIWVHVAFRPVTQHDKAMQRAYLTSNREDEKSLLADLACAYRAYHRYATTDFDVSSHQGEIEESLSVSLEIFGIESSLVGDEPIPYLFYQAQDENRNIYLFSAHGCREPFQRGKQHTLTGTVLSHERDTDGVALTLLRVHF